MIRPRLVVANAKMNLTPGEAEVWAGAIREHARSLSGVTAALAPAFPALACVARALRGSPILLAAQDVFGEVAGAYTGEVSARMLRDAGVTLVLVGHSERRRGVRKESEADFARKMERLVEERLAPLYCVGETLEEREGGHTGSVLVRQMAALDSFPTAPPGLALAYEPVWAIGSGRSATPAMAAEVHVLLRTMLEARYGRELAEATPILYGGSVTPENASALCAVGAIDGALVGGASLDPEGFARILRGAARA